jgi:hypothetical protein
MAFIPSLFNNMYNACTLVDLSYNVGYAYLTHKTAQKPSDWEWMQTHSNKISIVRDSCLFVQGCATFIYALACTPSRFITNPDMIRLIFFASILGTGLIGYIGGYFLPRAANTYFKKITLVPSSDSTPPDPHNNVYTQTVNSNPPDSDVYNQFLTGAKISLYVALAIFGGISWPFCFINIACQAFSLVKIAQRKWITFTSRPTGGPEANYSNYAVEYSMLVFERAVEDSTPCVTCQEDPATILSCTQDKVPHYMCEGCVSNWGKTQVGELWKKICVESDLVRNSFLDDYYKGHFLPRIHLKDSFPLSCPECRKRLPGQIAVKLARNTSSSLQYATPVIMQKIKDRPKENYDDCPQPTIGLNFKKIFDLILLGR